MVGAGEEILYPSQIFTCPAGAGGKAILKTFEAFDNAYYEKVVKAVIASFDEQT